MEDLDNGIKDGLSSFHLTSIIQLFTTAYKVCETKLHESFYIISLLEQKQYNYLCFEQKQSPTFVCC